MPNLTNDTDRASLIASGAMQAEDTLVFSREDTERQRQHLMLQRRILAQAGARPRMHALIVEDQAFSRGLLYQVLSQTCAVAVSSNARDGWKTYLEDVPDIIFLDIDLASGASGHALADQIKELDPASYVVMVTASQDIYDIQIAKFNHVDGFVIKPFNKRKIDACIERFRLIHRMQAKPGEGS